MDFNFLTTQHLDARTTSSFGLSIPTGLAFESLFNPTQSRYDQQRHIPEYVDVKQYDEFWINIKTLFRNIARSSTKEILMTSNEINFKNVLESEIDIINSLFMNEGGGICKPMYYYCTYQHLYKTAHSTVQFRKEKTDLGKTLDVLYDKTIQLMKKVTEDIHEFDSHIAPKERYNSLILTHVPYDLLSYTHFKSLKLLESHTGVIKSRNKWYSKYHAFSDKDLAHLPFNKKLLFIFGDKVMIMAGDYKLRQLIYDISIKRKWTSMTTMDKILLDCTLEIKEPYVLDVIRAL